MITLPVSHWSNTSSTNMRGDQDLRPGTWLICWDVFRQNIEVFIFVAWMGEIWTRCERGILTDTARGNPILLSKIPFMLTPPVLSKHWFMLHNVMASSAIKYAGLLHCLRLPLPDTEHPEILSSRSKTPVCQTQALVRLRIKWTPILFKPPFTPSWIHYQTLPFSIQDLDDRNIPTHIVEEVKIFLLPFTAYSIIRSDWVTNKFSLKAFEVTQPQIILFVDCSPSVR